MSNSRIYARLNDIFHDIFSDDSIVLRPEMTAADIPGWDSFNHINIVVATETEFGIKFNTAEIESLRNVGDLAAAIERRLGAERMASI